MKRSTIPGFVAAAAVALACAGSPPPSPPSPEPAAQSSPFPSAEELESLAEKRTGPVLLSQPTLDVESWDLTGPFPERIEVIDTSVGARWDALVDEAVRKRPGLVLRTEAMRCIARETGSFYLANKAQPGPGLQRYIATRCNAAVPAYRAAVLFTDLPESISEDEIYGQWRDSVVAGISGLTSAGASTAGVWFGRSAEKVVVMMVAGTRIVHIEPVATVLGPDASLVLAGDLLVPASDVAAVISRGRFGFERCSRDPAVVLPRFAFVCQADPDDDVANVTLSYTPPGRLIAKSALNVRVWPSGKTTARYQRPAYTTARTAEDGPTARALFVELLNEIRREAGLEPVVESREQSQVASELAPHFFAAMLGDAPENVADQVALGMIAGWGVDGILQTGRFTWSAVSQTNDVGQLLSEAMEYPSGREVLLARDAERVAVGTVVETSGYYTSMAVLVGTYSLFSPQLHAKNAEAVFVRFQKARLARGAREAGRLEAIDPLIMTAAGVVQAGVDPSAALGDLLRSSAELLRRPVNGWISEVSNLEDLEFPDDFVARPSLGVAVGVSYHQPPGEPWGRYVVILVAAEPESHRL